MAIICGVYALHGLNGDLYLGSSGNCEKRFSFYKSKFKNNEFLKRYPELQNIFNINPKLIKYEVVDICEIEELKTLEKYYISYFKAIEGFNVLNKNDIKKLSTSIRKIPDNYIYQQGENHPNCKLTLIQAREIKMHLRDKTYTNNQLSQMYNVSPAQISRIKKGERWACINIAN